MCLLANRKKKQGKGKKKGSDDSDSDDVEVIKEWNTSSRGRNGEGRNRAESVEERECAITHRGDYDWLAGFKRVMNCTAWLEIYITFQALIQSFLLSK